MTRAAHRFGCVLLAFAMMVPSVYAQDELSSPTRTQVGVVFEKAFQPENTDTEKQKEDLSMPESHQHQNIVENLDDAVNVWVSRLGVEVEDENKVKETQAKALDNSPRETVLQRMDGDEMDMEDLREKLKTDSSGRYIVPLQSGAVLLWDIARREGIRQGPNNENKIFYNVERRYRHSLTCNGAAESDFRNCIAGEMVQRIQHEENENKYIGTSIQMKSDEQGAVYDWHGNENKAVEAEDTQGVLSAEQKSDEKDSLQRELSQHESWIREQLRETNRVIAEQDMAVEMGGKRIDNLIKELSVLNEKLKAMAAENPNKEINDFIDSANQFLGEDLEQLINAYLGSRSENMEILHERKSELDKALVLIPGMQEEIKTAESTEAFRAGMEKFHTWISEAVRSLAVSEEDQNQGHAVFSLLEDLIQLGRQLAEGAEANAERRQKENILKKVDLLGTALGRSMELKQIYEKYQKLAAEAGEQQAEDAGIDITFEPAVAAMLELKEIHQTLLQAVESNNLDQVEMLLSEPEFSNLETNIHDFEIIADSHESALENAMDKLGKKLSEQMRQKETAKEQEAAEREAVISGLRTAATQAETQAGAVLKILDRVSEHQSQIREYLDAFSQRQNEWTNQARSWISRSGELQDSLQTLKDGFESMSEKASIISSDSKETRLIDMSQADLERVRDFMHERSSSLIPVYSNAKTTYKALMTEHHDLVATYSEFKQKDEEITSRIALINEDAEERPAAEIVMSDQNDEKEVIQSVISETLAEEPIEPVNVNSGDPESDSISLTESSVQLNEIIEQNIESEKPVIEIIPEEKPQFKEAQAPVILISDKQDTHENAEKLESYFQKLLVSEPKLLNLELSLEDLKYRISNLVDQARFLATDKTEEPAEIKKVLDERKPKMKKLYDQLKRAENPEASIRSIMALRKQILLERKVLEDYKVTLEDLINGALDRDLKQRKIVSKRIDAQLDNTSAAVNPSSAAI